MGPAHDREEQRRRVRAALNLLTAAKEPGVMGDLTESWAPETPSKRASSIPGLGDRDMPLYEEGHLVAMGVHPNLDHRMRNAGLFLKFNG